MIGIEGGRWGKGGGVGRGRGGGEGGTGREVVKGVEFKVAFHRNIQITYHRPWCRSWGGGGGGAANEPPGD